MIRYNLFPLFALVLLLTACSESATGPEGSGPSLGVSRVQVSGGRSVSFEGVALSTQVSAQNYQQITLSTSNGEHLVGVSTYGGSFQPGAHPIGSETASAGIFAVYGYTTSSAVENYGSTNGTLTITEVTSSGIRGKLTFSATEANDRQKSVSVTAEFFARKQ